ncbi:hypothetical protein [Caballeronia sp. INSB1]|uniref:hypothetical protein n=1 Tax=Caballeronia sp. INSB1 TaxID=2921751 RepID=UPI002032AEC4|nr:hypothetical protein [Caballeronia sp. INSB1]
MDDDALNALPAHAIGLRSWLNDWYDHAYKVGYVHPPFELDDATATRLEGYFQAGLTPAEGAIAFFANLH